MAIGASYAGVRPMTASLYEEGIYNINYLIITILGEALVKITEWGDRIPIGIYIEKANIADFFSDHFRETIFKGMLYEPGFPLHKTIIEMMDEFR